MSGDDRQVETTAARLAEIMRGEGWTAAMLSAFEAKARGFSRTYRENRHRICEECGHDGRHRCGPKWSKRNPSQGTQEYVCGHCGNTWKHNIARVIQATERSGLPEAAKS